jgi:flagellar assembly factor FliW
MWQHFMLEVVPDTAPLMLLHSLDEERLSFIVADPQMVMPDYQIQLSEADRLALGNPAPETLATIAILNPAMQGGATRVTANLLGPLVINVTTGIARQIIQPEHSAHYLVGEMPTC